MVETIKSRDTGLFERDAVNFLDEVVECLRSLCHVTESVEH